MKTQEVKGLSNSFPILKKIVCIQLEGIGKNEINYLKNDICFFLEEKSSGPTFAPL